jgi:hypothetical protein
MFNAGFWSISWREPNIFVSGKRDIKPYMLMSLSISYSFLE